MLLEQKRKIIGIVLTLILLINASIISYAEEIPSMNVNAKAAVLMEPYTGKLLLSQNANEKLAPASVTKVMTLLLIYEALHEEKIKWDDIVTTSAYAAGMGGSQIYLEAMEQQPLRDLVKSIVIASANDAAVTMAEFIAGSEEGFVIMMNQKAKSLGMNDTNFVNACGLDADGHVTSAYDIALMTKELITKYPEVFEFTRIWQDTITHKTARGTEEFGLTNTNRLVKNYNGATGLKTGSTSQALYCLSGTAQRDNLDLIAVVLGAPDPNTRFHETMKMLDYGFANYAIAKGDEAGTEKGRIKIFKGEAPDVGVIVKTQASALVSKGNTKQLESKVEILDGLNAPVDKNTKAGEIIYSFDGKEVTRSDLVVSEEVERAQFHHVMKNLIVDWFK